MKTAKHLILFTVTLTLVVFSGCSTPQQSQNLSPNLTPSAIATEQPQTSLITPTPATQNLDCNNAQTQSEMTFCAAEALKQADTQLNAVYGKLRAKVAGTPQETRLIAAEQAWIDFRDKDCEYSQRRYDGGSMMSMIYAMCLTDLTEKRTQQLELYLEEN